tara:strand:+ start:326 stop:841 length:516 start_codon:yes stop_codon:yes gene_type:complete
MALLRPYKPTTTFVVIFVGIVLYFYGFLKNDFMFEIVGIISIAVMYLLQVAGYIMKASANNEKIDPTLWLITLIRIGAIGFVGYVTAFKEEKGLYKSVDNMEDFRFSTFSNIVILAATALAAYLYFGTPSGKLSPGAYFCKLGYIVVILALSVSLINIAIRDYRHVKYNVV